MNLNDPWLVFFITHDHDFDRSCRRVVMIESKIVIIILVMDAYLVFSSSCVASFLVLGRGVATGGGGAGGTCPPPPNKLSVPPKKNPAYICKDFFWGGGGGLVSSKRLVPPTKTHSPQCRPPPLWKNPIYATGTGASHRPPNVLTEKRFTYM